MNTYLHSSLCHPLLRFWCSESPSLKCSDFMYPIFVTFDKPTSTQLINNDLGSSESPELEVSAIPKDNDGSNQDKEIVTPPIHVENKMMKLCQNDPPKNQGIPGVERVSLSRLIATLAPLVAKGLKSILMFAYIPDEMKDSRGSAADSPTTNPALSAIYLLTQTFPRLLIACDLCLCNFTDHGHCGMVKHHQTFTDDAFYNDSRGDNSHDLDMNVIRTKRIKKIDSENGESTSNETEAQKASLRVCEDGSCTCSTLQLQQQQLQQQSYNNNLNYNSAQRGGFLDNFASVARLVEIGLAYSRAGAHIIAPSDMMDGRIGALKRALIAHGLQGRTAVMSYSAKFASALYGPFRDMVGCKIKSLKPHVTPNGASSSTSSSTSRSSHCLISNDRSTYQLPVGSSGLAMRALERDVKEGADILMVKPASLYLDIVKSAKTQFPSFPLAVYHVSGEYTMLYHAAQAGSIDLETTLVELVLCMKRAGADIIITYFTPLLLDILTKTYNVSEAPANHREILSCMAPPSHFTNVVSYCPYRNLVETPRSPTSSTIANSIDSGIILGSSEDIIHVEGGQREDTLVIDGNGHSIINPIESGNNRPSQHMSEMLFL